MVEFPVTLPFYNIAKVYPRQCNKERRTGIRMITKPVTDKCCKSHFFFFFFMKGNLKGNAGISINCEDYFVEFSSGS